MHHCVHWSKGVVIMMLLLAAAEIPPVCPEMQQGDRCDDLSALLNVCSFAVLIYRLPDIFCIGITL